MARDVAIVVLDVLDSRAHSELRGAGTRVGHLLVRNIEGADLDAVVLRHVKSQRAPATTRLDDALSGAQADLATDVIHLGGLRLIQRGRWGRVVGAGIRHGLAEPERVELVADVV